MVQGVLGSGNFLRDRGYADPDQQRAKFDLSNRIGIALEDVGGDLAAAAGKACIDPTELSRIVNGNVAEFTLATLASVLAALEGVTQQ